MLYSILVLSLCDMTVSYWMQRFQRNHLFCILNFTLNLYQIFIFFDNSNEWFISLLFLSFDGLVYVGRWLCFSFFFRLNLYLIDLFLVSFEITFWNYVAMTIINVLYPSWNWTYRISLSIWHITRLIYHLKVPFFDIKELLCKTC